MTPEERVARIRQKLEEIGVRFERFSTWSASELVRNERRIADYERMIEEHEIRIHEDHQRWRKLHELQSILMESQDAAFRSLERLEKTVERLLGGESPNGQAG